MNRLLYYSIPVLLFFVACAGSADRRGPGPSETPGFFELPRLYAITDFKHNDEGERMPEWVVRWLEGGITEVEAMDAYHGRFVFISRSEGNNFNALSRWAEWFNADLDFPRLAAARIEARFGSGVSNPDSVYGAFFEALIRTASDARWTGAVREDDFWIRRKFYLVEEEIFDPGETSPDEEDWKFLVLVTMDQSLFASQLNAVFRSVHPSPRPTREQTSAANRVKDRFFYGF